MSACTFSVDIPLTERRLLAVRADAVEEYADYQDAVAAKYAKEYPGCYGEESARDAATSARKFSQYLRNKMKEK